MHKFVLVTWLAPVAATEVKDTLSRLGRQCSWLEPKLMRIDSSNASYNKKRTLLCNDCRYSIEQTLTSTTARHEVIDLLHAPATDAQDSHVSCTCVWNILSGCGWPNQPPKNQIKPKMVWIYGRLFNKFFKDFLKKIEMDQILRHTLPKPAIIPVFSVLK